MNNIDQQLEKFKKEILQIDSYQFFTNGLYQKLLVYENALEVNNIPRKRSEITDNNISASINYGFKDYRSGGTTILGTTDFTINESRSIELELKNRQYQFLLLHAFEAFEQYLKSAEHFINNKPITEKIKRFYPTKFIVNLHKTVPTISRIIKIRHEDNPDFLDEINLLLTFSTIEQIRHQITHASGYAHNKSDFIMKCLNRIGRYNNGKPKSEHINYFDSFFGSHEYENWICLIELRDSKNSFFYFDRLGKLVEELVGYIFLIHDDIKHLISEIQAISSVTT